MHARQYYRQHNTTQRNATQPRRHDRLSLNVEGPSTSLRLHAMNRSRLAVHCSVFVHNQFSSVQFRRADVNGSLRYCVVPTASLCRPSQRQLTPTVPFTKFFTYLQRAPETSAVPVSSAVPSSYTNLPISRSECSAAVFPL